MPLGTGGTVPSIDQLWKRRRSPAPTPARVTRALYNGPVDCAPHSGADRSRTYDRQACARRTSMFVGSCRWARAREPVIGRFLSSASRRPRPASPHARVARADFFQRVCHFAMGPSLHRRRQGPSGNRTRTSFRTLPSRVCMLLPLGAWGRTGRGRRVSYFRVPIYGRSGGSHVRTSRTSGCCGCPIPGTEGFEP